MSTEDDEGEVAGEVAVVVVEEEVEMEERTFTKSSLPLIKELSIALETAICVNAATIESVLLIKGGAEVEEQVVDDGSISTVEISLSSSTSTTTTTTTATSPSSSSVLTKGSFYYDEFGACFPKKNFCSSLSTNQIYT